MGAWLLTEFNTPLNYRHCYDHFYYYHFFYFFISTPGAGNHTSPIFFFLTLNTLLTHILMALINFHSL